jgi:hypothetical protein
MAEASPGKSQLSATLWGLVFAACLLLAAAHLAMATRDQALEETGLIEATFTQAPSQAPKSAPRN